MYEKRPGKTSYDKVFIKEKLAQSVYTTAVNNFYVFSKFAVDDDHVPLNAAGIPAIDIIDFDYPHWHKLTDVPENCSGESLEQVARVLTVWLQRLK